MVTLLTELSQDSVYEKQLALNPKKIQPDLKKNHILTIMLGPLKNYYHKWNPNHQ